MDIRERVCSAERFFGGVRERCQFDCAVGDVIRE